MEEMLINERFKSPNKEFEKVFNLFRKKDYFDEKSQVKKKQEEFVRFLKKGDPMATKVFKQNKEDMKSSLSFIEDMVMDYNKKNHFEAFQIFSKAVNNIEMKDSKSAEKSGNFIKSKIHNNSQKYSLGIYSAIRKQNFNNYKDVHKDVDELISKNEGFSSDAQRKAAFANGYEEKGKKKNESVNEGKVDSILKRIKSAYDKSKNKKLDIKKLKDQLKTYKKLGASDKKDQIKAGEMFLKSIGESVNEGKKRFKRQDGIGKAKYTISYHDGKKKHKDGSDFFDIKIFKNKKDLSDFVGTLAKQGYKLTRESVNEKRESNLFYVLYQKKGVFGKPAASGYKDRKDAEKFAKSLKNHNTMILDKQSMKNVHGVKVKEGINEAASKEAMGIAGFTGTRGIAVQKFIDDYNLDSKKLFNFVKKGKLKDRMTFVTAIAGKPGNKHQGDMVGMFGESKKEVIAFRKKAKSETAFYDILDKIERKYGRGVFEKWLDKSLKDLKLNPKKYKTSADKQEALYQAKL